LEYTKEPFLQKFNAFKLLLVSFVPTSPLLNITASDQHEKVSFYCVIVAGDFICRNNSIFYMSTLVKYFNMWRIYSHLHVTDLDATIFRFMFVCHGAATMQLVANLLLVILGVGYFDV
jgi:hypothetical protein